MSEAKLYSKDGAELGTSELPQGIFNFEPNNHLIYEAVKMYQANLRLGTVATKNRSRVSGGGKKPFKQKGTGRARQGTTRAGHHKGGGLIFGPMPRDYYYTIPKKMRRGSLKSILSLKAREGSIIVVEEIKMDQPKASSASLFFKKIGIKDKRSLVLLSSIDENIQLAMRNFKNVNLKQVRLVNTLDIIKAEVLVITKDALNLLREEMN